MTNLNMPIILILWCIMFLTVPALKSHLHNYFAKKYNQVLYANSKEVEVLNQDNNQKTMIASGSPLSLAAVRTGLRLSFQCKQGTCASCETLLDGKRVRTCITKVPDKAKINLKKAPPL